MRLLTGDVVLPANAPVGKAAFVLVEVRDVSVADAPSVVIAQQRIDNVTLRPAGHIGFQLPVPVVSESHSLALRVHISIDGSAQPKPGDLLSTTRYAVPGRDALAPMQVLVSLI